MNWFWMNIPLMAVFFAAWVGIPMWLVLRHPDTGPAKPVALYTADDLAAEAAELLKTGLVGVS